MDLTLKVVCVCVYVLWPATAVTYFGTTYRQLCMASAQGLPRVPRNRLLHDQLSLPQPARNMTPLPLVVLLLSGGTGP